MNYEILPIEEGQVEAEIWLEENKHQAGYKIFQTENHTYLLIASEVKTTGGYQFELIEIQELEKEILVKLKFINPANDQVVIQMLTHPYMLIKFDKTEKKIIVQLEEELG